MPADHPHHPWDHDMPCVCPICHAQHDAMANVDNNNGPEDGDPSICIVCKGISIFDSKVPTKLRFCTDEELTEFMADPRIRIVVEGLKTVEMLLGPLEGDYFS